MALNAYSGTANNGAESFWALKLTLDDMGNLFGGWSVQISGDGLSSAGASGITTYADGAGGLNNPSAWLLFFDSNTNEQFLVQRSQTSSERWRVTVSKAGTFSLTVYGPKQAPRATDELVVVDYDVELFGRGAKTYAGSASAGQPTTSFAMAFNEVGRPVVRTILSYDFNNEKRFVYHMGEVQTQDLTRFRKVYPIVRQQPRIRG
jgi:hypothetical protein